MKALTKFMIVTGSVTATITATMAVMASPAFAATGTTWTVDKSNNACSDAGAGTAAQPFCTITRGAKAALPGDTVLVNPGTYAEVVSPPKSGAAGSPITFRAAGPGVVVSGGASQFKISSRSWITVDGFTVTGTTVDGIAVSSSTNIVLTGNTVSFAGKPVSGSVKRGIKLSSSSLVTVSGNTVHHNTDAGIYLDGTTHDVQVVGNTAYANARQYTRAAPGIDVRGYANTVTRNVSHDNEDSGLQFYTGAHDNLVTDNVTYDNGDHGIDDLGAANQRIISNTVFHNVTAGINAEGSSTGVVIRNNISVDNGTPSSPRTKGDIRVDSTSQTGSVVDDNLVFQDAAATYYTWGTTQYASLAAFQAATGQEAHGISASPLWVNQTGRDFHLTAGSPAINTADTSVAGQPAADIAGIAPHNDRGAYER
jgi:parallel beta-helix repeat protein